MSHGPERRRVQKLLSMFGVLAVPCCAPEDSGYYSDRRETLKHRKNQKETLRALRVQTTEL